MDDATKDQTPDGATPPPPNAMRFPPEARNPWALSRQSTAPAMFACMCQGEVGSFTYFFLVNINMNVKIYIYIYIDKSVDRQIDRKIDRKKKERKIDRQTDR